MNGFKFYGKLTEVAEKADDPVGYCENIALDDYSCGYLSLASDELPRINDNLAPDFTFLAYVHCIVGTFQYSMELWQVTVREYSPEKIVLSCYFGGSGRIGGFYMEFTLEDEALQADQKVGSLAGLFDTCSDDWSSFSYRLSTDPGQPVLDVLFTSPCGPGLQPPSGLKLK